MKFALDLLKEFNYQELPTDVAALDVNKKLSIDKGILLLHSLHYMTLVRNTISLAFKALHEQHLSEFTHDHIYTHSETAINTPSEVHKSPGL